MGTKAREDKAKVRKIAIELEVEMKITGPDRKASLFPSQMEIVTSPNIAHTMRGLKLIGCARCMSERLTGMEGHEPGKVKLNGIWVNCQKCNPKKRRRVMERLLRYETHYSSGVEGYPPRLVDLS